MRKATRHFGVRLHLPWEERAAFEEARRRLGLRSWGAVALLGWARLKAELGLSQNGGGNDSSE